MEKSRRKFICISITLGQLHFPSLLKSACNKIKEIVSWLIREKGKGGEQAERPPRIV